MESKVKPTRQDGLLKRLTRSLTLVLCVACRPDELFCTTVGGFTGLTIELSAQPVGSFVVEVVPTLSQAVSYTYRCDGGPSCRTNRVRFPGLIETSLTVRVTTSLGVRETPQPDVRYTDSYPNGKACGPRATTATVQAAIPE
jgi:hypothetical protein